MLLLYMYEQDPHLVMRYSEMIGYIITIIIIFLISQSLNEVLCHLQRIRVRKEIHIPSTSVASTDWQ